MPLYRPSELFHRLQEIGARPQKRLSQHFLTDGNILRKLVGAADIQEGECVLEIGPGPGAITEALLSSGARVVAVEKDPLFAHHLPPHPHLRVIESDILEISFENEGAKMKVVANPPYQLISPLLERLLPLQDAFSKLILIVQKEVAERLVAPARSKHYSSLSLFVRTYACPAYLFTIAPSCFYPAPKVDSAAVLLTLTPPPKIDLNAFFTLTRTAFQQRRKMLKVSLQPLYQREKILSSLEKLSLNPLARPEELSFEEFLSFFLEIS